MLIILPLIARQRSIVPKGLRNFFEAICVFIREEVARPVLGHNTDRFRRALEDPGVLENVGYVRDVIYGKIDAKRWHRSRAKISQEKEEAMARKKAGKKKGKKYK